MRKTSQVETTPFTDTRQFKVMRRVIGALNPLMKRLVASRFGGPLNRRLLVLRYQGRKSGRTISTPAGYVRDGDRVVIVTNPTYGWWRNFTGGGDAELHLPEGWRRARLEVLAPVDARFDEAVALQVSKGGPGMLRGFGVQVGDQGEVPAAEKATFEQKALIVFGSLQPGAVR